MTTSTMQAPGSPVLFYDGTCGFCHGAVAFVLAQDRRGVFRFAALQSRAAAEALAPHGGVPADLTTLYVLAPARPGDTRLLSKARAALLVADELGWPWRAARVLGVLPGAWLDAGYDLVARHRHALFGRRDTCFVPRPDQRARFLDAAEEVAP